MISAVLAVTFNMQELKCVADYIHGSNRDLLFLFFLSAYSLIKDKRQGGNKYVLPITVKFDQSTRRFGRMSFARLYTSR